MSNTKSSSFSIFLQLIAIITCYNLLSAQLTSFQTYIPPKFTDDTINRAKNLIIYQSTPVNSGNFKELSSLYLMIKSSF